jgi:hypothetical protein
MKRFTLVLFGLFFVFQCFALKNETISPVIQNQEIDSTGVNIMGIELKEMDFFKSYLVEVTLKNFSARDIDGKLYGRVLNPETLDVITQNNNCAFTRNGSEIVIEIVFPDLKIGQAKGKYMIEIELVDKEKDEEVIDTYTKSIVIE